MKAFAQEPGDPQTSLPSTRRLATHYYKVYDLHSARRPARRGVRGPSSIDQSPIDHGAVDGAWWICGGYDRVRAARARVHVIDNRPAGSDT